MARFEPDGVYDNIPYRVLLDCSIEAMMPTGLVKFKNMDELLAFSGRSPDDANGTAPTGEQHFDVPTPAKPVDYYSILMEAINATQQNSAQLRALVYERARFNLKRDILFGYSLVGLADVARQINEFELAVARIEANAIELPLPIHREHTDLRELADAKASRAMQILPPKPLSPLYAWSRPIQRTESGNYSRLFEEFARHVRFTNKFIGIAAVAMVIIGTVLMTMLWPSRSISSKVETASKSPQTVETTANQNNARENGQALPFPLPGSFGIYVLGDSKLTELEPLPINVPDPRIALSAEIDKPSTTAISDDRPAFILFRRDLLNAAPQKITLRIIARMARETKIVEGKAKTSSIDGAWRIRNISRELKISPISGQREMLIARMEDDVSLAPGRYALVLNKTGYDFTITGATQSPAFCLEKFETTNGSVFNQCRTP